MKSFVTRQAPLRVGLAASLVAAMALLSACNTMQGAGKDIERGGEKMQDAARSTKEKM
jgi:entericidin B